MPVHLSLLDKRTNLVLQNDENRPVNGSTNEPEVSSFNNQNRGANDTRDPWILIKEKQAELDPIGDKVRVYYDEDDVADEEESSLAKKRFDREDSTTTSVRPTTMRGTPITQLTQNLSPRGFYVTKGQSETPDDGITETFTAETTTLYTEEEPVTEVTTVTNLKMVKQRARNVSEDDGSPRVTTARPRRRSTLKTPSTEASVADGYTRRVTKNRGRAKHRGRTTEATLTKEIKTKEILNGESSTIPTILETLSSKDSKDSFSTLAVGLTVTLPTIIESTTAPVTEFEATVSTTLLNNLLSPSTKNYNDTSSESLNESSVTENVIEDSRRSVTSRGIVLSENVTERTTTLIEESSTLAIDKEVRSNAKGDQDIASDNVTEIITTLQELKPNSVSSTVSLATDEEARSEKSEDQRIPSQNVTETITTLQDFRLDPVSSTVIPTTNQPARHPKGKIDENPTTTTTTTETSVASIRRKQQVNLHEFGRRGNRERVGTSSGQDNLVKDGENTQPPRRRVHVSRGRKRKLPASPAVVNDSVPEASDDLSSRGYPRESKLNGKKRKRVEKEGGNGKEGVRVEDNVDRRKAEVNTTKSTVTSLRTPGTSLTNRFRKPAGFTLVPPRNKSPSTIVDQRNNSATDGTDKPGSTNDAPETPKPEKDLDQTSRAQELAVTVADPPLSQASATGRPSLRNPALRRRISTTLAPRTVSTTARTIVPNTRAKDRPRQNATARPRRPQVVDYDYYEDEEEPVVGKSTFNGKLFLTSKGSIRCLDQGNFPHPYSCRKFITCARMVNGLVVGAEYTCPDKLSFDPVGGICNWSAGLGCKE